MKYEKELLGFYLSDHPLYKYERDLCELTHKKVTQKKYISAGGVISDVQYRYDKNGKKWAQLSLDTLDINLQLYVFNDVFLKYEDIIKEDSLVYILGKDFNQNDSERVTRLIVNRMFLLTPQLKEHIVKHVNIQIDYINSDNILLDKIEKFSQNKPGKYSTVLHLISSKGKIQKILSHNLKFSIDQDSLASLRKLCGLNKVWLSL